MNEDIALDSREKKEAIAILKRTKFEDFKIHYHYYNKFGHPRHGISLDKFKEIYPQFDKIISVSKRPSTFGGDKYCFIYRIQKKNAYYLIFLLDEKPMQIFDAYFYKGDIEKRLMKKYLGYY